VKLLKPQIVIFSLLVLALTACDPIIRQVTVTPTPTREGDVMLGEAQVVSVVMRVLEPFPEQVYTVVYGYLPNPCTVIGSVEQSRSDNVFTIRLNKIVPAENKGKPCSTSQVPYEETIPLEVKGLNAGTYSVNVNGVIESFELGVDPTPATGSNRDPNEAPVETVELLMLESFPVQVHAVARGNLPDACTTVGSVEQSRTDNTFNVKISTVRPADKVCVEVLTPFEQNIPLDVHGLKAGTYTVNVNGVTETFEMQVDNVLP